MDSRAFAKVAERALRCTENLCALLLRDQADVAPSVLDRSTKIYSDGVAALSKACDKLESRLDSAPTEEAACAKAWLSANSISNVHGRIIALCRLVRDQAAVATSPSNPVVSRCQAVHVVLVGAQAPFNLIRATSLMALRAGVPVPLENCGTPSARVNGRDVLAVTTQDDYVHAVADAARGVLAVSALLHSESVTRQLGGSVLNINVAVGKMGVLIRGAAHMVCEYLESITHLLTALVRDHRSADGSVSVPPELTQVVEALADSQLLAAAAATLVDGTTALTTAGLSATTRHQVCSEVRNVTNDAARAVSRLAMVQEELAVCQGQEGTRLAAGLWRMGQHGAVRRLQVALLDQLAAEAGMGPRLQGPEGMAQQQEAEAEGWAGSSGMWWLAREEAERGQLLGFRGEGHRASPPTPSSSAGCLEDIHSHALHAATWTWGTREPGGAAGAWPPPLLAARLTARAAEALCRLCRGEGLDGGYGPAPEWLFARAQPLVTAALRAGVGQASLSTATAQACLPYWLEAAGWMAALMSDATAAALGRLPASRNPWAPRSRIEKLLAKEGSQARTLCDVLEHLHIVAGSGTCGYETLPPAAQADVRRCLFRCGLAATLDHTLRLAYSAQDSKPPPAIALDLERAVPFVVRVLYWRTVPMLALAATPVHRDRGNSGGGGCGSSGEAIPQLGLLLTLSKRAATLARGLEAVVGTADGGAQGHGAGQGRQQVLRHGAEVLYALALAMQGLQADVRLAGEGEPGAHGAPGVPCTDEVRQVLALAGRAVGNLGTVLAWALAEDVAEAGRALNTADGGGTEAAVPLAWYQDVGQHAVRAALTSTLQLWVNRYPLLLSPEQLLACQPHRLLAAACALAAALPAEQTEHRTLLVELTCALVVATSSHKALSGAVLRWLAPPPSREGGGKCSCVHAGGGDGQMLSTLTPPAAATGGGGGEGGLGHGHGVAELATCAGCLKVPVYSLVQHAARPAPGFAMAAGLLHMVAQGAFPFGEHASGSGGDTREETFRQHALTLAGSLFACLDKPSFVEEYEPVLPDGTPVCHVLEVALDADGQPPPPSAPLGALPPPLALPPSRSLAFPLLRMCGNPQCVNFAEECEGALKFKQCGGCLAVRYCGKDCQRAHWREGHRAECKHVAARVE